MSKEETNNNPTKNPVKVNMFDAYKAAQKEIESRKAPSKTSK